MVLLKKLQAIGYTSAFFKLPEAIDTYYTFDNSILIRQPSYWNIVGMNPQRGDVFYLDLQILYIDEEALQYKYFSALHDADSFLFIHLDELQAFIHLLEETFDLKGLYAEDRLTRFSLLNEQGLAELHFDEREIRQNLGRYYRYHPDSELQTLDKMSLIGLPRWEFEGKSQQSSTLTFATFDRERLKDPAFQILDSEWLGFMRFDLRALNEFLFLLKQRT